MKSLTVLTVYQTPNAYVPTFLKNPKTAEGGGGRGQFDHPFSFSKVLSSKERVKPWFFVTFNVIISHIFPENFIEITQIVKKI